MKKLTTTFAILINLITFAQTKTKVFEYTNGVRNLTPSQIIISTPQQIEVYNTTNGVQNLTPTTIIKPNGNVHKVENHIPQLLPIRNIQVENGNTRTPVYSVPRSSDSDLDN